MRISKVSGSQERTVLIGMICDRAVLGAVASRWVDGMFDSRWGNLIGKWCIDYFNRYKKPPGKNIVGIFDDWANEAKRDKETVQLVETFLTSLNGQYVKLREQVNADYTIDLATKYFTRVKQKELAEAIQSCLEDGDIDSADSLIHKYSKVEVGADLGIDVLEDEEAQRQAFESKSEPLIKYKHGLETFFGGALERDAFIGVMGPEKRGKTWVLLDLAWQAMKQGRKVAFFEVGDLSRNQIMRRFMVRAAGRPILRDNKPITIRYPTNLFVNEDDPIAEIFFDEKQFKKSLTFEMAQVACNKILQRKDSDESLLKLSVHANSTISVHGIFEILVTWERRGWVPDVVVIDYADILAPPSGVHDTREQINATWKALRAMSQAMHSLVITATQAKTSSYSAHTISMTDFADDKRKFAHVTGMIGLSQTPKEKQLDIVRYNWVALREESYTVEACCHVARCLALAKPAVISCM